MRHDDPPDAAKARFASPERAAAEPDAAEQPLSEQPDEWLVGRAQQGDREAFGLLVERHQASLYQMLWQLTGSREDASDATQEAFVQAFLKVATFRGEARFSTWLYRIGVNQALAARRRRRPSQSLEAVKEASGNEPIDAVGDPAEAAVRGEQARGVQAALNSLDEVHRQVLVLRELEGCSYESIAEVLEIPVGTVRSRLFRARLQLRAKLSDPES